MVTTETWFKRQADMGGTPHVVITERFTREENAAIQAQRPQNDDQPLTWRVAYAKDPLVQKTRGVSDGKRRLLRCLATMLSEGNENHNMVAVSDLINTLSPTLPEPVSPKQIRHWTNQMCGFIITKKVGGGGEKGYWNGNPRIEYAGFSYFQKGLFLMACGVLPLLTSSHSTAVPLTHRVFARPPHLSNKSE